MEAGRVEYKLFFPVAILCIKYSLLYNVFHEVLLTKFSIVECYGYFKKHSWLY